MVALSYLYIIHKYAIKIVYSFKQAENPTILYQIPRK